MGYLCAGVFVRRATERSQIVLTDSNAAPYRVPF